jgi:hypothetical protein
LECGSQDPQVYERAGGDSFHFTVHQAGDQVALSSIDVSFTVDDLYDGAFDLPGDEHEPDDPQAQPA